MKVLGLQKGYFLALIFFVLPVGGILVFPYYWETTPHSFMQSIEKNGSLKVDDQCQSASDFDDYLKKLNKANKPNNIICKFSNDLTTMSKTIICEIMNGPPKAQIYWAENLKECERLRSILVNKSSNKEI
jgi:hypothetical protein